MISGYYFNPYFPFFIYLLLTYPLPFHGFPNQSFIGVTSLHGILILYSYILSPERQLSVYGYLWRIFAFLILVHLHPGSNTHRLTGEEVRHAPYIYVLIYSTLSTVLLQVFRVSYTCSVWLVSH